jgi:competence protein ComEC
MNKKIFILITSFWLFYRYTSKDLPHPSIPFKQITTKQSFDKTGALKAYCVGDKRSLKRKIKKYHKKLYLQHLFTPSGIHLTSIFLILNPLLRLLKRVSPRIQFFSILGLYLLPYLFHGFYSMKRISLIRIGKLFFPNASWFAIFLISFLIDFFFGTFNKSPLSFCFSFLFLGLIFANHQYSGKKLVFSLLTGQVLVSFFWNQPMNLAGALAGQFLTFIFSFFFPIFLIGHLLNLKLVLVPLNLYLQMITWGHNTTKFFPEFSVTLDTLLIFFFLCLSVRVNIKLTVLLFYICLYPKNLYNLRPKYFVRQKRNDFFLKEDPSLLHSIKRTRRGYKLTYKNGYICYYHLFNTFWRKQCR